MLHHWVWMNGGEWMDKDLFGTVPLFGEPKAMEALQFSHDMIYGPQPISPTPGSIPDFGWYNVFSTGKMAFVESHSWMVTNYIRENGFKWDFTNLPTGRDGKKAGLTFTNGYSIYQGTKYPEESVKLLKFLIGDWAVKQMCLGLLGLQPARRSMAEIWDKSSMGAQAGYDVAAFNRMMDSARLIPEFKDSEKIKEIFDPIWDQIWVTAELPLEEGVNLAVKRINDYYAANP